jgi:hypothetical protein
MLSNTVDRAQVFRLETARAARPHRRRDPAWVNNPYEYEQLCPKWDKMLRASMHTDVFVLHILSYERAASGFLT